MGSTKKLVLLAFFEQKLWTFHGELKDFGAVRIIEAIRTLISLYLFGFSSCLLFWEVLKLEHFSEVFGGNSLKIPQLLIQKISLFFDFLLKLRLRIAFFLLKHSFITVWGEERIVKHFSLLGIFNKSVNRKEKATINDFSSI